MQLIGVVGGITRNDQTDGWNVKAYLIRLVNWFMSK